MTFEVRHDYYSGPMEKLLSLVQERQLEISRINLAAVTADFIAHVEQLGETANSAILSDFVVVAARLLVIKSKELIPTLELTDEEESQIIDLEHRLQLYREFKNAGELLKNVWNRKAPLVPRPFLSMAYIKGISSPRCPACSARGARHDDKTEENSSALRSNASDSPEQAATLREQAKMPDHVVTPPRSTESTPSSSVPSAQAFSRCSRCGNILDVGQMSDYSVFYPSAQITQETLARSMTSLLSIMEGLVPIESRTVAGVMVTLQQKMQELTQRLQNQMSVTLKGKASRAERQEVIVLFLAVLHLLAGRLASVEQEDQFGDIVVSASPAEPPTVVGTV